MLRERRIIKKGFRIARDASDDGNGTAFTDGVAAVGDGDGNGAGGVHIPQSYSSCCGSLPRVRHPRETTTTNLDILAVLLRHCQNLDYRRALLTINVNYHHSSDDYYLTVSSLTFPRPFWYSLIRVIPFVLVVTYLLAELYSTSFFYLNQIPQIF